MGIFDKIGDALGSVFHAVTGTMNASEKRQQKQAIQSQVDYYRKQSEISDSQISQAREQQMVEKRRINEKQIRSLRRSFRPAGLLDSTSGDIADNLGG